MMRNRGKKIVVTLLLTGMVAVGFAASREADAARSVEALHQAVARWTAQTINQVEPQERAEKRKAIEELIERKEAEHARIHEEIRRRGEEISKELEQCRKARGRKLNEEELRVILADDLMKRMDGTQR